MSQGIRPSLLFVVHIADGGNSCGLGHAPTVSHIHLVHIAELGNQGFGHGGTAHASSAHGGEAQIVLLQVLNQAHPNRWDTGAQGDFFGLHQFIQTGAVQLWSRQNQFGTRHQTRIRQTPCIDMKHGHNRQHCFLRGNIQNIGQTSGQGTQHNGPVRVQNAFRVSCCSRGVTKRSARVFV